MQLGELLAQRQQEIETWTEQIAALESEAAGERARAGQIGETLAIAQEQVEKVRIELVDLEGAIGALGDGAEFAPHRVRVGA